MLVARAETLQGVDGERHLASWAGTEIRQVVILCHSLRDHAGQYDDVGEALVARGSQVYALDQAGHGRSEGSPGLVSDLEAAVDDQRLVVQLARARHPDTPVVVVGHGTGGTIAVRLAQQLSSELSAVVAAAPLLGTQADRHPDDPRLSLDPFPARELSRDPVVAGRFFSDPLVWRGELPVATAAALHRGLQAIARGPRLRLPVLWLHGTADRIVPPEPTGIALRQLVAPEALTEVVVPGARHQLLLGSDAAASMEAITPFLAANLRRPAVA